MKQVVIENPVINSPFEELKGHFRFSDEGITNEIANARRFPVNGHGEFGRRTLLEIRDPWNAQNEIHLVIQFAAVAGKPL